MKYTLRLPTQDQYAFIEVSGEVNSIEDAVSGYSEAMKLIKPQAGLSAKDFNAWIDRYLTDNTGDVEMYVKMNPEQMGIIQAIKRSVNRISAKNK